MRNILLICVILFLIDLYVFQAIKFVSKDLGSIQQKTVAIIYWSLTVLCLGTMVAGNIIDWHSWPKALRTYVFAFIFVNYFSKLFILIFLLIDDIYRLLQWLYGKAFQPAAITDADIAVEKKGISRTDFLVKAGLIIGSIPFISLIYGMVGGAYNYKVRKVNLALKNLPDAFKGFKILQISDIHSGSFNSTSPLKTAVDIINDQNADVVFFTGDLVNDQSIEAEPYIDILSQIKAHHGVYSTFGNHDYGDYIKWPSLEAKINNLENLKKIHAQMGWKLLFDENTYLERNNEKIGVVGIQNWSSHLRFPKYGSMEKATKDFEYASVNILLSHDPSHWQAEVLEKYPQIDLMLAGHTHGFQFGIEIPGIRWSPVQYVYKEWAGIYTSNHQHLYVNRGLGFLGYPGRVGILPEITVITLDKA